MSGIGEPAHRSAHMGGLLVSIEEIKTGMASLSAMGATIKQFKDTPFKSALIELQNHVIDVQGLVMALQNEFAVAHARIRDLEEAQADVTAGLEMDRGVYWKGGSREHGVDGPYCAKCVGTDRKRVTMTDLSDGAARCPHCKTVIHGVWPELADAAERSRQAAVARAGARFKGYGNY